jgi:DNA (cytosine-5)-methyltransferase 1
MFFIDMSSNNGKRKILSTNSPLKVLDLFCGAGGFSEGFRNAGFEIIAGIDSNVSALETFSINFPESVAIEKDLSSVQNGDLRNLENLLNKKINIIIGGPPCQGFSIAGKRLKDDPRNQLYKVYLNLIEKLKPKAIVLENVPTILGLYNGEIARQILEDFNNLGYKTESFTLIASDYGVPQNRKRTFFVGIKGNKNYKIPAPTTASTPLTTKIALSDLPLLDKDLGGEGLDYVKDPKNDYQKLMRKNSKKLFNHWAVEHKQQTIDIISLVPDGGNYKDLPENLRNTRRVNIAWTRMNSKKPCFTIDAGHNHHFHYKANRVPTVRECARIQSFPDKFRFYGNKTSQFRQVGNAVPPLLAKIIALSLKKFLI